MLTTEIKLTPVDIEARKGLDIRTGDTIKVWTKIVEKDKTRLQAFEGLVLAKKHGKEIGATILVRRVVDDVGVERIFPLYSPIIDKIKIIKRAKARRAKLYYIRDKAAKVIRKKMRSLKFEIPEEKETIKKKEVIEILESEK